MGFSDYRDLTKFINYDFRSDIRNLFPNYAALVIGYLCLPFLIALIIFSVTRICYVDTPQKDFEGDFCCVCCVKTLVILAFLLFFLGYYIYIIYKIATNKNECEYFQKMDAASFYMDFIEYFCSKKNVEKRALLAEIFYFLFQLLFSLLVGYIIFIIIFI